MESKFGRMWSLRASYLGSTRVPESALDVMHQTWVSRQRLRDRLVIDAGEAYMRQNECR